MTPEFQRSNSKWSREMQISFIENIICGYRSEIMLYSIKSENAGNCFILDGLQRTTSIQGFLDGEFPIFEEIFFKYLMSTKGWGIGRADFILKIYEFSSHVEACKFYISMNKNITHSPEDLIQAYKYLERNDHKS
jgi:hypothetical protein